MILAIWLLLSGGVFSQIAPFYSLKPILFPVCETALLKHNDQSNFKASFRKKKSEIAEMRDDFLLTSSLYWISISISYTKTKLVFAEINFAFSK